MHISNSGVNRICQKKKKKAEILQQKFHSQSIKPQVQKFQMLNCEFRVQMKSRTFLVSHLRQSA